jgi:ParB-like nuclease domain
MANKNVSVKFTQNLGMFKLHNVNREVDSPRVKRITESMKKDGLKLVPIIVNSNFVVVDGQHRVTAAKEAGKGIYYIVDNTIPNTTKGIFEAARKFNQNMKEWGKKDYIHGFSEQGNKSYKTLEEFSKEFPMFSLTERIMLLQNSGTRHVDKQDFADGKFIVGDMDKAKEWANNLLQLKPYFEKGYNKSVFVRTLLTIMEKKPDFKFEEFLHKVKLRPSSIFMCGDKKSYAEMIEDIYNYKRRTDEKLNLRF